MTVRPPRLFGLKDCFTAINALAGAIAIYLCIEGRPFAAGVAVVVGYGADVLDGAVARLMGTQNAFGAEFDTIVDHLSHCAAPATIVYTIYAGADLGLGEMATRLVAGALAGAMILAASIRHALNAVRPPGIPGVWHGMPRTVQGFVSMGFASSQLVETMPAGYWVGIVVILAASMATLSDLPFPNHRLPRGHRGPVRALIGLFFATTLGALLLAPRALFDVLFFWMAGYSLTGWLALTRAERLAFRRSILGARANET